MWFAEKLKTENSMYTIQEIKLKSKLVRDVIEEHMSPKKLHVDDIYLIGSYASGRANEYSDIDYLVQLKGGVRELTYPDFNDILAIKKKINNERIHVIFGTINAQLSMCKRDPVKYAWKALS